MENLGWEISNKAPKTSRFCILRGDGSTGAVQCRRPLRIRRDGSGCFLDVAKQP